MIEMCAVLQWHPVQLRQCKVPAGRRREDRMPHEIAVAYLIISRMVEPPPATEVSRSVAAAGLGVLDYEAAGESGALASGGRRRIGTFNGAVPGTAALVRMVVWRAGEPVTTGMGEPALNVLAGWMRKTRGPCERGGCRSICERRWGMSRPRCPRSPGWCASPGWLLTSAVAS